MGRRKCVLPVDAACIKTWTLPKSWIDFFHPFFIVCKSSSRRELAFPRIVGLLRLESEIKFLCFPFLQIQRGAVTNYEKNKPVFAYTDIYLGNWRLACILCSSLSPVITERRRWSHVVAQGLFCTMKGASLPLKKLRHQFISLSGHQQQVCCLLVKFLQEIRVAYRHGGDLVWAAPARVAESEVKFSDLIDLFQL